MKEVLLVLLLLCTISNGSSIDRILTFEHLPSLPPLPKSQGAEPHLKEAKKTFSFEDVRDKFKNKGLFLNMLSHNTFSTLNYWNEHWPTGVIKFLSCSYVNPNYGINSVWTLQMNRYGVLFDVNDPNVVIHGGAHLDMIWENPKNEHEAKNEWVLQSERITGHLPEIWASNKEVKMFLDKKYERVIFENTPKVTYWEQEFLAGANEQKIEYIIQNFDQPFQPQADMHFSNHNEIKISVPVHSIVAVFYIPGLSEMDECKAFAEALQVPIVQPTDNNRFSDLKLVEDYAPRYTIEESYGLFAYNVKSGKDHQNCCWARDAWVSDEKKSKRDEQIKFLNNQLKSKVDFAFLVEVRGDEPWTCAVGELKNLARRNGFDVSISKPLKFNCGAVLWKKSDWTKVESETGCFDECNNRMYHAVLLKNKFSSEHIIVTAIQQEHNINNLAPLKTTIEKLAIQAKSNRVPVILAGDFNLDQSGIQDEYTDNSMQLTATDDELTCCAGDGYVHPFDHFAFSSAHVHENSVTFKKMPLQNTKIRIPYNSNTGKPQDAEYFPKWAPFSPAGYNDGDSAEHLPISMTVPKGKIFPKTI